MAPTTPILPPLNRSARPARPALERPEQINIDARHAVIHQTELGKAKYARCGNCGTRYEITDDATENHHRAMEHKQECGKGSAKYTEEQRHGLLDEFRDQPMQRLFRERLALEIEAGADPNRLELTGVDPLAPPPARRQIGFIKDDVVRMLTTPRRWYQFWRWFE